MSHTGQERRRHQRIGVQARAIVYAADRKLDCVAYNLSESGVLLLPPARARAGLALRVNLGIPGLPEWITANAVLVREGEFMGRYAWGVRFTQLTPHSGSLLRSFIRRTLRGETEDPQMSEAAQSLLATDVDYGSQGSGSHSGVTATQGSGAQPAPAAQARHLDSTGPMAPLTDTGSQRGIRPTAPQRPVPQPETAPRAAAGPSDEYTDPFADLPTATADRRDVDEHASREIDIPTEGDGDWEEQASNVNLAKLYKEALDDVTPKKEKKKKGWFS